MVDLSIVVCSFNGAQKLGVCLSSLEAQSARDRVEVIVVDDGSLDATAKVAAGYEVNLLRHETNRGLSAARNSGFAAARASIVAFLDDDCVAPEGWAQGLLAEWERAGECVTGIGGVVIPATTDTMNRRFMAYRNPLAPIPLGLDASTGLKERIRIYLGQRGHVAVDGAAQCVSSLVGANMSFRVDALKAIGGFDERRTFGGDEAYVCEQLRSHFGSETLWCEPDIIMKHDYAPGFRDTLRRGFAYGKGLGRNQVTDGGLPSIQPLGLLAMLAATLTTFAIAPIAAATTLMVVPPVLQRRALRVYVPGHGLERFCYPWLVVLEECAVNVGLLVGWVKAKTTS